MCAERPDPDGAAVGEPPEPQPISPSAARPRQAAGVNARRMGIRAMLAVALPARASERLRLFERAVFDETDF